MKRSEFEKDLEIDIESLDAEATIQPELFFKYASMARDARENYDLAKMQLNIIEAELARKVREAPAAFGVAKVTEASIKEAVLVHPRYKAAYENMVQTRSEADLLNKAQETMDQRKRMLELLVQLHGREYFAGPSVPHTPEQFWKSVRKKKGEKTHAKMIKRGRKRKKK